MPRPVVAIFCMPEDGHFKQLRPIIRGLSGLGFQTLVLTHRRFQAEVAREGGRFFDLFTKYPLELADAESLPVPCRYVSFAGVYGEQVLRDLREIGPSLIVYETFAVIGRLAGLRLGLPYVNVSAGHNMDPTRLLPLLRDDPRVRLSPNCHQAVAALRERHGLSNASSFSYVDGLSPYLNICCEPPAYLDEAERRVFEPAAFFGCLSADGDGPAKARDPEGLRIYASFGTVIWRYYAAEAIAALKAISESVAARPGASAIFSLAGAKIGEGSHRELEKINVRVLDYVDQPKILSESDLFVTHHGMNSTHEAVFHRVPMLSYPFFGDQPLLAEKCRQFGIAVPLTATLRGRIGPEEVRSAIDALLEDRESMRARLEEARDWELEVIAGRDSVLRRIAEFIPIQGNAP